MAVQKNTADLLAQAANTTPNNSAQEISPQDVREVCENIAFSSYNKLTDAALVGAKEYNSSLVYSAGDVCTYDGFLQVAKGTTTAGAFDFTEWQNAGLNIPIVYKSSGSSQSFKTPDANDESAIDITTHSGGLFTFNNPTGTPANMQKLIIRLTNGPAGTDTTLGFGSNYDLGAFSSDISTAVISDGQIYRTEFEYSDTLLKWVCIYAQFIKT
ncbi:hypothetical protein [uncultured Mediterranean phage uvMED]|nr:hypothetical protein [uncultured Mediterranean phage uvMED]BAR22568.1 hypothetical protein [uncultured Mediterranean phage uvMED]